MPASSAPGPNRCSAGWARSTTAGRFDGFAHRARAVAMERPRLTTSATHLWRLLKWGRTLARHGALRGIENDPATPPPVRTLARIARFGARIQPTPAYLT